MTETQLRAALKDLIREVLLEEINAARSHPQAEDPRSEGNDPAPAPKIKRKYAKKEKKIVEIKDWGAIPGYKTIEKKRGRPSKEDLIARAAAGEQPENDL